MARYKVDRRTGKKRRIDPKKSKIAKRAARRRVNRPVSPQTRRKISRNLKRTYRTGRTKYGRNLRKKR